MLQKLQTRLPIILALIGALSLSAVAATSACWAGYELPAFCPPEVVMKEAEEVRLYLNERGYITVAVLANEPPFSTPSSGDVPLKGIDIDVAHALAKKWSDNPENLLDVRFVVVSADTLAKALNNQEVDLAIAAINNTSGRCNEIACSEETYLTGEAGLLVRFDSDINSFCDLNGKVVAVVKDTKIEELLPKQLPLRCNDFEKGLQFKFYSRRTEAVQAVRDGFADVHATHEIILNEYANGDLSIVDEPLDALEDFRVAVPQEEVGWLTLITKTLTTMQDDGTYEALYRKWQTGFSLAPGTELHILQWKHFVPGYDKWFDDFATNWGETHGITMTVSHIDIGEFDSELVQIFRRQDGPTLIELLFPPTEDFDGFHRLGDINQLAQERFGPQAKTCQATSYLDGWGYYGYCHGYAPDPVNYRMSLWQETDYPNGPRTFDELLKGGQQIRDETHDITIGLGMANELDSEMAMRAVIWSYGGSIQDKAGNVALNSPETVEAVKYLAELYQLTMSNDVFKWTPQSNNDAFNADAVSMIINSISAYRQAQSKGNPITEDTGFLPPLSGSGPKGTALASAHTWQTYVVPKYATTDELNAAKAFMLHLTQHYDQVVKASQLYNFPAFPSTAPSLNGLLEDEPKLAVLKDVDAQGVHIGYPGTANPAVVRVFNNYIITKMVQTAILDEDTDAKEAVAMAEIAVKKIFDETCTDYPFLPLGHCQ